MIETISLTKHAEERCVERAIPQLVAELIYLYGEPENVPGGARKHALTSRSIKAIRRDGGKAIADVMHRWMKQKAYVIAKGASIITAAFVADSKTRH